MSKFEDAVVDATKWLSIPGVETIIANDDDFSILVLTSCSANILTGLIPDTFKGFQVNLYCVAGLHVNKSSNPSEPPLLPKNSKPVRKVSNE